LLSSSDTLGARQNEMAGTSALKTELNRLLAKAPWTPELVPYRGKSAAAMAAEIDRQKLDARWSRSKECTDITRSDSRTFCQTFQAMLAAKAIASDEAKDNARIAELRTQLGTASYVTEADPFAKGVSEWTNYSEDTARYARAFILAVLLEFLPSLGPALLMMFSRLRIEPKKPKGANDNLSFQAVGSIKNVEESIDNPSTQETTAREKGIAANIVPFMAQGETGDSPSENDADAVGVVRVAIAAQSDPKSFLLNELMEEIEAVCATRNRPILDRRHVGKVLNEMGYGADRERSYTLTPARADGRARLLEAA
jgi:hypothetical protein